MSIRKKDYVISFAAAFILYSLQVLLTNNESYLSVIILLLIISGVSAVVIGTITNFLIKK
ncbi:hypothetical protein FZC66_07985 [Priestia megaterium]|nr:hypothetical protein FZC66_07985 [Priestia megaterium]